MQRRSETPRSPFQALVLALASALPAGCGDATGGETSTTAAEAAPTSPPAPAAAPLPVKEGPSIAFETKLIDMGERNETVAGVCTFPFVNDGTEELVISDVKSHCGCVVPELEIRRYAPGERGEVEVTWSYKNEGPQLNSIDVLSNAKDAGLTRLQVKADVQPFVRIVPPRMSFGRLPPGGTLTKRLELFCPDPDLVLHSIESNFAPFSATFIPSDGQRMSRYWIEAKIEVPPDQPPAKGDAVLTLDLEGTLLGAEEPTRFEKTILLKVVVDPEASGDDGSTEDEPGES